MVPSHDRRNTHQRRGVYTKYAKLFIPRKEEGIARPNPSDETSTIQQHKTHRQTAPHNRPATAAATEKSIELNPLPQPPH